MFNVLRNNIARIQNKSKNLNQLNIITKTLLYNNKFTLMTYNKQNNKENKIQKNIFQELNFQKIKINKIISHNYATQTANPEETKRSTKPTIIDEQPEFYENLIEEVSKSPNLNVEEKTALIEKLKVFFDAHLELNNNRKGKDWAEIYYGIVRKLAKEDNETNREKFQHLYDTYKYSKFVCLFILFFLLLKNENFLI